MRRSFAVIASILAGCLIVGLLFSRASVSQVAPTAPPQRTPGRYQMQIVAEQTSNSKTIVVCDTTNGQCWTNKSNRWTDLGFPTIGAGKEQADKEVN
jgi:hypothetical protein